MEKRKRFQKNKNLLNIPAVINSRFLASVLKIVVHGKLNAPKLSTINSFFKMVDHQLYEKDLDTYTLLKSVEAAVAIKLDGMNDPSMIMSGIEISLPQNQSHTTEIVADIIEPTVMNVFNVQDQEIDFIMRTISLYTKYGFILEAKEEIVDKFVNVESGSAKAIAKEIEELEKEISSLHMKLHRTHSNDEIDITEAISILDPEFMEKHMSAVYKASKNKKKILKTGIQALNEMLNGGFQTGKMYLVYAPINSFKSAFLLYNSWWIAKYNSENYVDYYKTTGKRPTVLFVSLENTWDENLERLMMMVSGGTTLNSCQNMKEVENVWEDAVKKSNPIIDIVFAYARANRFGVSELEQKIDQIETEKQCKVVAVVIDFLRNMKDDFGNTDPRLKCIQIATDLHELVIRRPEMALITAHHTTADGDRAMRERVERGGVDKVKALDRTHAVESKSVEEPVDGSIFITPEQSPHTNQWYLGVKLGKARGKRPDREYFALPLKNKFLIMDDLNHPKPSHVDSIAETDPNKDKQPVYSDEIKKTSVRETHGEKAKEVFSVKFSANKEGE